MNITYCDRCHCERKEDKHGHEIVEFHDIEIHGYKFIVCDPCYKEFYEMECEHYKKLRIWMNKKLGGDLFAYHF